MNDTTEVYEPTPADVEWARVTLELLKPQATWVFPGAGMLYKIDQIAHTVSLDFPLTMSYHQHKMHERARATFSILGYEVFP